MRTGKIRALNAVSYWKRFRQIFISDKSMERRYERGAEYGLAMRYVAEQV